MTEPQAPPPAPDAATLIRDLDRGNLHGELTDAIASVTAEVVSRRKAGKVVVELQIAPADDQARNVLVAGRVTAKPPAKKPAASIYFPDQGGGLHRDDPYSRPMVVRDLDSGAEVAARNLYDPLDDPEEDHDD